jgi:hypothetical protein
MDLRRGVFGPQIPQRDEAGRWVKPPSQPGLSPTACGRSSGWKPSRSPARLTPEGAILFPEILARWRPDRAGPPAAGRIHLPANTPEQRDLHNWSFGRLCRVMEDYCTSSPRIAEVVQAAEDSGFGGGSVSAGRPVLQGGPRPDAAAGHFRPARAGRGRPDPRLTWVPGRRARLRDRGAVEPWYATTGQDLGQDRPLMDRIFAAYATVLAKQWQRVGRPLPGYWAGDRRPHPAAAGRAVGCRKRRQPTFGGNHRRV